MASKKEGTSSRSKGSKRSGGKSSSEEALSSIVSQVQSEMKSELQLKEVYIPNSRAEARCKLYVSPNYAQCEKMVLFVQPGKGVKPGIWSRGLALKNGLQASMMPYFKSAIQNGFGVIVMNPNTNSTSVRGHKVRISGSSTPEEHVMHVWENYVVPYAAESISFVAYDLGGPLVKYLLKKVSPDMQSRLAAVAFIESAHQRSSSDPKWLTEFLATRAANFESSPSAMFAQLSSGKQRLGCPSLSAGQTSNEKNSRAWTINSIQASVFVFLQAIDQGLNEALNALRATVPNKLVVTVNRARLTGQPYNNPFAVVQCVGQKKETIGNHKHTMDPEWNQTFSFPVNDGDSSLLVSVKDKVFPISNVLGQVVVTMTDVAQNRAERKWFTLRDDKTASGHGSGEVELTLEWVHDTFVARSDSFIRGNSESSNPRKSTDVGESHCYLCNCTFVLHRRRHCRMCLRAVCVGCSDRLFLPGFSEAKRVCTACCNLQIMMHKQGGPGPMLGAAAAGSGPSSSRAVHQHQPTEKDVAEAVRNVERMHAREAAREEPSKPLSIEDFELLKVVGRGAFGKVMLVKKLEGKKTGQIYAMKILKKAHIIKNDQVENTKAEQHILKEIDHPYIVRLRFAFQNEDKLYLVMDYYPGGSLFYHLRKSKRFSEDRTRLYMAQLLTAIMHLHSKQIAYRDLKLENILMDEHGHIALTDFGLSKEGQEIQGAIAAGDEGMKTICGTAEYMAPELLRHQRYGKVVDWWSYGILLYEMFTGRTPFVDRNRRQMFKNIMQMEVDFPAYIPPKARSLISQLLNRDPAKRLGGGPDGGRDIMAHEFFESIDWDVLLKKNITPPFKPNVSGEADVTNVPQMFQNMEPVDSPVGSRKGEGHHFEDFSFEETSRLRRGY